MSRPFPSLSGPVTFRFAILVALAGLPESAAAQIYTWRDTAGTLVLSDRRPEGNAVARSYAVPVADGVRATRDVVDSDRAFAYDDLIQEYARLNGVRANLVRAIIEVESGFNPAARSGKGAMGLMQLMPGTARELGVRDPFDAAENIRGGTAYLRQLLDRFGENERLALAAYNAGPGAVTRHGEGVPPDRETADYITRVHRIAGETIPAPVTRIYRTVEVIDGREVVKYTDRKPN